MLKKSENQLNKLKNSMRLYHRSPSIILFILFVLLTAACRRPASVTAIDGSGIAADLEAIRKARNIPAVAAIVVRSDTMLQAAALGVHSLDGEEQQALHGVFHLGSLSQAITATTIASLVEEGKLSWESRPEDIFPQWKNDIHPALREITLDQMLRHASGLTGYCEKDAPEVEALPEFPEDPVAARQAFARYAVQHAPLFTPGSGRRYSNAGYAIAAAMAEEVSGLSWEALVAERVFSPLGMQSATFGQPSAEHIQVLGYVSHGDSLTPLDTANTQRPAWRHPAEDLFISVVDYGRFLQMQLQGLRDQNGLLKAATIQYLHAPMGIDPEALGWDIQKADDGNHSIQASAKAGFFTAVLLKAEENIAVAVFTNSLREKDEEAILELLDSLANRYSDQGAKQP